MSSSDIYTSATELAILSAGRAPVWTTYSPSSNQVEHAPLNAAYGVPLSGAVRTLVHVSLREEAWHRTARLSLAVVDANATYSVTINGTTVNYVATADTEQEIMDGIAAAINANGTIAPLVTATAVDTTGSAAGRDTVLIQGDVEADFSLNFTATGTADPVASADPVSATVHLWWSPDAQVGSTPPAQWVASEGSYTIDRRGWVARLDSAGFARMHVEASAFAGHASDGVVVSISKPRASIGPCLAEVL